MSRDSQKTKRLKNQVRGQNRLMAKAAHVLKATTADAAASRKRNDFWRNLLVASAFARGLGNERPISDVIEECVPALLGINRPMVPGQVPA